MFFFYRLSIRASLVRAAAWIPRGPGLQEAQGLWRPGSSGSLLTETSWQISGTTWEATMRPATNPTGSPRRLRLIVNLCGSCRNSWTSQKCGNPWKWGARRMEGEHRNRHANNQHENPPGKSPKSPKQIPKLCTEEDFQ